MDGRTTRGLAVAGLVLSTACSQTATSPAECPEAGSNREAKASAASAEGLVSSNPDGGAPRSATSEKAALSVDSQTVRYRVELEDRTISTNRELRHLTWTCRAGSCGAEGPPLQIGAKSCVSVGATLGSVVTSFQIGEQQLDAESLARCQAALLKQKDEGKFRLVAERRQRAEAQPSELDAAQTYFEVTNYVGQMQLRDGSLRFVFPDGGVALLREDGTVFRFDAERRLSDSGRFVRWHSVGGEYAGAAPLSKAVLEHCSRTNGGIQIEPWQIRHDSTLSPACDPHRADFRGIFRREPLPAVAVTAAHDAAFRAPYADDARWQQPPRGTTDPVLVGSAESVPGYFKEPARDTLEKVQTAVQNCARYVSDPTAQLRGEVLLILGAFGAAKTALVRRTTYPDPERFSACIEQNLMQTRYRSTYDVNVRVPFQLGSR